MSRKMKIMVCLNDILEKLEKSEKKNEWFEAELLLKKMDIDRLKKENEQLNRLVKQYCNSRWIECNKRNCIECSHFKRLVI